MDAGRGAPDPVYPRIGDPPMAEKLRRGIDPMGCFGLGLEVVALTDGSWDSSLVPMM